MRGSLHGWPRPGWLLRGWPLLLMGCQALPPVAPPPPPPPPPPTAVVDTPLSATPWLQLADELRRLDPDQARLRLGQRSASAGDPTERYTLALLNQQLGERAGWVAARDQFRALQQDATLADDLRRLARLLEGLSQAAINAEQQLALLRLSLAESRSATREAREQLQRLEEQIEALTALERSMQQRSERQNLKP